MMKSYKTFIEGSKEEYQKFFDKKLKKYKVSSPSELSDEEKKKFFDEIDKEWTGDHEEDDPKAEGCGKDHKHGDEEEE